MIEVRRYNPSCDAKIWNQFVADSKQGTFLLHRSYMDYHRDRFTDHSLMIYRNGKLYGLLPGNESKPIFYSHQGLTYGGLITSDKATTADICDVFCHINEYLREAGFQTVIYKPIPWIYHHIPAEEDLYALFKECHAQLVGRNIAAVIDQQHAPRWYNIRKAGARKASQAHITIERSEDYTQYWQILTDNLMHTYQAHPVHTLEEISLLKSCFKDNIQLYVARQEDKMLGGVLLYITPQVVHTQYISASEEGKQKHALDALFYHLIKEVFSDYKYFDFGTSNEDQGRILNSSLIYQKEGFGGRGVVYDTYKWKL